MKHIQSQSNRHYRTTLGRWASTGLALLAVLAGALPLSTTAQATEVQSGFQPAVEEITWYNAELKRPVKVTIWYPKAEGCKQALICVAEGSKTGQPLLLSHGAMGAAKNYNWLGYGLASQGYITAGVNHYGESWAYGRDKVDHSAAVRFWQRPQDMSFALDRLASNQKNGQGVFSVPLNWEQVVAVGHSSGGATALSLAGAGFELKRALEYCDSDTSKGDRSCGYLKHLPKGLKAQAMSAGSAKNERIKALVVLDPALGHIVDPSSVEKIDMPALVVGSKHNDFLVYQGHGEKYVRYLPQVQHVALDNGEGHFVYLDVCHHPHKALGVSLCKDRDGVNRAAVHQAIMGRVLGFLSEITNKS